MITEGRQVHCVRNMRWHDDGRAGEVSHERAGEYGGRMATAVAGVHQGMQKVAFLFLHASRRIVPMLFDRLHMPRYAVLGFMHVAHGRQHRIHQYRQHQHHRRGKAQQPGKVMASRKVHGSGMLPGTRPVTQSRKRGSSPAMDTRYLSKDDRANVFR